MPVVDAIVSGAMDEEVEPFLRRAALEAEVSASELSCEQIGETRLWRVTISGRDIVVMRTGIGLVNAASGLTAALHRVKPALVISTGSAGGIKGKVHVGDVAVGSSTVYSMADARAFGYALGQVPGMPPAYTGDAAALARAQQAGGSEIAVVAGQVTSGDVFVDADRLAPLREQFPDVIATDMESTALAQVAFAYGVAFLTVRGISDLCGPDAGSEHPRTLEHVSEAAARVALAVIG